jgi:hypothetical protein
MNTLMFKIDVLQLKLRGFSQQQIADALGSTLSQVKHVLPTIYREILTESGAEASRAMDLVRLEQLINVMWPQLIGKPNDPDFCPTKDNVMSFLAVLRRKAQLVGSDAPDRFTYVPDDVGKVDIITNPKIGAAIRMTELMDAVAHAGLGSGRAAIAAATHDPNDPDNLKELYEDAEQNDEFRPSQPPIRFDADGNVMPTPSLTEVLRVGTDTPPPVIDPSIKPNAGVGGGNGSNQYQRKRQAPPDSVDVADSVDPGD